MTTDDQPRTDAAPEVQTWWVAILNGIGSGRHPLQPRLEAVLDGDTLRVSGAVGSDSELADVERDARRYCGDAVRHIEFAVEVEPDSDGKSGLLRQVLWASFENCEQATTAANLLRERLPAAILDLAVLERASDLETSPIPPSYVEDVKACLHDGGAVLIIEADETDTFHVQEALDQDTRSLQTTVIPPIAPVPDPQGSRAT